MKTITLRETTRNPVWEKFEEHIADTRPVLQMKVQDGGMGCAMEMEEFDQALLEFALDNYDSPGDPGLSRLVNDLTNQAALGYGWERVDDIISDPWKQQAMNLQDSLHGMLRERWSNTEKTEGEGKMAGVVLDPQSALQYGIDAAAIEAALGRRVTVWREPPPPGTGTAQSQPSCSPTC